MYVDSPIPHPWLCELPSFEIQWSMAFISIERDNELQFHEVNVSEFVSDRAMKLQQVSLL